MEHFVADVITKQLAQFLVLSPDELHLHLLSGEVRLQNVRLNTNTINKDYATASPLLVKKGIVGLLRVQFKPLRVDAINVLVEDIELEVEPRPPDSDWWSKQAAAAPVTLDRSQQLALLDPEAAAIEEFAKDGAGPSRLQKIAVGFLERLTAAVLGALRVEVRNVRVSVVVGFRGEGTDVRAKGSEIACHRQNQSGKEEERGGYVENIRNGMPSEVQSGEQSGPNDGGGRRDARPVADGLEKAEDAVREGNEDNNAEGRNSVIESAEPHTAIPVAPGGRSPPGGQEYVALEVALESFILFEGRHGQNGGSGGGADKGSVSKHTQLGGLAIRLETSEGRGEGEAEMSDNSKGLSRAKPGESEQTIDSDTETTVVSLGGLSSPESSIKSGEGLASGEEKGATPLRVASVSRRSILLPNEIDTVLRINKLGLDRVQVDARTMAMELDVQDLAALAHLAAALSPPAKVSAGQSSLEGSEGTREAATNRGSTEGKPGEAEGKSHGKGRSEQTPAQDSEGGSKEGRSEEGEGGLSEAALRWQKAFRLIREQSHSTRLHGVLEAGAARRRYVALYAEWLRAIGWGEDAPAQLARQQAEKRQPREVQRLKARLHDSLQTTEGSLPIEAIVVARKIARAQIQGQNGEDAKGAFLSLSRGASGVQKEGEDWWFWETKYYKSAKAIAKVLYAVLWGLLNTLWTIVVSPYNGFVSATHVMQARPEADPWAVDDDVTPAEITSAKGDEQAPAGAPAQLALTASFHIGAGSVTFSSSRMTSAPRQQEGEAPEGQAVRLTWSRLSLSATQSGGEGGGAVYLARVTLGSVDCNCISVLSYSTAIQLGRADSLSEPPRLESTPSGGFLRSIFGLERQRSEGVEVDEVTERDATFDDKPRLVEGSGGNTPLFVSGFAPEWKTGHPKASSKLLGMGAFCNRGLGRARRAPAGSVGGGLSLKSRLLGTNDPGSRSLFTQPSLPSDAHEASGSQTAPVESTSHARKPSFLSQFFNRPFSHLARAPSLARLPSFSSQTSSLATKQGPSREEQAAAERRRERRERWRARLAANRPFAVAAVEVNTSGFMNPGDDEAAAVTCGASVGRLSLFVGLDVLDRVGPILSELRDLAASLDLLSTPSGATAIDKSKPDRGTEPGQSGKDTRGVPEVQRPNSPSDVLTSSIASVFTLLGPSICAAAPSIRLDVSAVVDLPRLILTGGAPDAPSASESIIADAGQLALSLWPVSPALHQQERRRRASQVSASGRTPPGQGLRAPPPEKKDDAINPSGGLWEISALELEAWDRHPSLPRDVVGGRYSQRFRIWNSARLTLSAASAAVADVSMSKLARREGGMEDFGATWLVEPAGVEVSASLLKEVGTSLFGGGTAASVVLGLRLAELAVDPLPDAVARAVGVASQLMRGVEKLVAELSPKTGALTQEAPSPGVGDVLGEGLKYTADTAAEVVVEQVPIPSLAKANQVELFSLAAYVHAAKLKANLSEGGKQEAERGSEGGLGRGKGSGDVRREGEEKTGEAGPQSPSGKSRAHGRWAHATRTITNLRRQAAENRGQRDPRPELAQTQARQRLEGVPAHVALEGAWLSVHLSGKDCQADVAGGLGAVRMEVGAKAQDEGWGVTALTDGKPGFGGERSQLTLGRCGFEASLGEVLRRGVRELEGEDTSTLFDDNSENRGLLTDQEISPPANLISAALQVGSLTFLESGEAGLTVTRHVKQAMTGPESLTLAVEIAEGLQAVSLHSTGGLFLVDSGALARAYAFLTDFATALSVSVSAGLSEGGGTPERPQRGDSASGKGATSSNSRSVTSDGQQPGADPFEASADMSRAGVKRSLEEGPETVINRSRSRGTSLSQSGKTVRWADVETAGEEQPYGESGGEVEEIGPESKSAAFSERKQGKERTESGGGLGNGTLEAPSAGGTSGVAGLDIKVTVSVKGVTTGLLRSIAVDLAPAGAVLMELDTTASVTTENGDLSARLDLSRVALLGVIPPPQEVGTRVSGESSSAALFKEAEHESAKTSSREHFGATVTRGFREQGRPSEDELSPALRGGRLILECLRLGAKVRSVPSEKSDGVSDDSFSWGGTRSGGLLPPPRAETSVLNPKALETLDANESKHLDRLIEAVRAQSGAWEGECHVSGADVAVTTSELQLLISIATPLYTALYATGTTAAVDKKMRKEVGLAVAGKDAEELALQDLVDIPDGAIVAIKDEQEQLFVSVEPLPSNPEHFRVVGKRHYTLADTVTGEGRALFKVKRHSKRGSGNKDQAWFSLLSLYARHPTSGEPFRLHFSPKTNQAGISTTNDGSWELFRLQAVEGSQYGTSGDAFDGAEGEGGSARKTRPRIHMVNKKAGKGLAFLEGAPVFTSKLGNPVKLKVLTVPLTEGLDVEAGSNTGAGVVQGQRDVIPTESTRQPIETPLELPLQHVENVAVALTSVPHVKVSVAGGLKATILHEAAGGAHILPLLRLSADDIGAIVTSGTRKSRAYAELVTSAEYFESQRSQWGPMVTNLALDVSYRGRSGDSADRPPDRPQKPLPFPFPKVPTNVFLFIRDRVDFELNQVAMDTLLFLVGALGLAGPYVVKYSPTQANQCRVENKTGVDLMCRFNDEEGEAARSDGVVRSFEGESFLIRNEE
ncbi:hypothetical protein KFL_002330180 [Klebsormidium nitens]|uniref:Uncharacterized protein n=1 Tax=Klebsormidium nitens TaxID=105231 RepID=A0A1Y1IBC4_KLENI|nr:hypothetical protein KFL_002330180 [Klebsormidium nitens]|eukprot:GAQ85408.1 hypothetical protein KFL_002330180 [Klebsormidium nitens]